MGLRDYFFGKKALSASPAIVEAFGSGQINSYVRLGGTNQQVNAAWLQYQSTTYAHMYETQPAVRKVIDYIARNTAQLGLKLYERESDTARRRDTDHAAILTMDHPNDLGPADQFIFNFVADFLVHENAYALMFRSKTPGSPRVLIQLPPPAVGVNSGARFTIDSYRIWRSDGSYFDVPPEDIMHWRGYNPSDPRIGVSRLETLRQLLAEDAASQAANIELLKAGLAKPGYIKRSTEAPEWSEEARQRFQESWANQAASSPRKTPVLEEGMEFADFGVSPKDAEMLAGRQFTSDEVASLYGLEHCPPEDEEERKQFIADVLAPITAQLASQLDFSILLNEYGEKDYYFEFDLNEKLRGDLENRFPAMTAAAGRPWRTVNETRALENMPPIDGGDELTIPLNVSLSGDERAPALPAPNVMPIQDPNEPPQDGSHRESALTNGHRKTLLIPRRAAMDQRRNRSSEKFTALLVRTYARQESALRSKAVLPARWVKWNAELADDLEAQLLRDVEHEGDIGAERFGYAAFKIGQVRNYLRAQAEGVAADLNRVTRENLAGAEVAEVFDRAKHERAPVAGMQLGTSAIARGNLEAARQSSDAARRTKTWIVTSGNSAHPEMDGETVALGASFSNGSDGPPADHPACQCILEIN